MRIISVCLIIFVVLILLISPILAHGQEYVFPEATDGQIGEAISKTVPVRFLPSSPLYFLIIAKEITARFFQPSSAKRAEFDFVLASKRLKETYLLLENGDKKNAEKSLARYSSKLKDSDEQLEKARSQNQDVAAIVAEMAEGFKNQEVLLFAISKKIDPGDQNLNEAGAAFVKSVMVINNVMPGVKDRFKTITEREKEATFSATPSPSPEVTLPASPSARPRRIIY